jgi:hypothetical protein
MTKREVFLCAAIAAMEGILSDPEDRADEVGPGETCTEAVARLAVDHAKALVYELEKRGELHG